MSHALYDGFRLIFDFEEIWVVVKFLESGFGWDQKQSENIINRLKDQATNAPKAAVFCYKNKIKIAILLFDQTDTNTTSKVINLSAWYAKETHRGIEAIWFAKKLTTALCDYTITVYTPSVAARKVFKSFGYEDMRVKVESIGVQKKFPFVRLMLKGKYFNFTKPIKLPIDLSLDQKDKTTICTFKIFSVKKMGIKLNVLNIFIDSQDTYISLLWLIKTIIFYRVVRVNIYLRIETVPTDSVWLIKTNRTEWYISPRKSELSV